MDPEPTVAQALSVSLTLGQNELLSLVFVNGPGVIAIVVAFTLIVVAIKLSGWSLKAGSKT